MDSDLAGRVRNTSLPKSKNLLPFFEAVVNSIQALDDSDRPVEDAKIEVEILRHPVFREGKDGEEWLPGPIKNIVISDNGPGFNDENMKSFQKLDSTNKLKYGCKGFGRVLWLKTFAKAEIESVYKDNAGQFHARNFVFSLTPDREIEAIGSDETTERDTRTTVKLQNLSTDYSCNKTTETIAQSLLDHCIWYFLRPGGAPDIVLRDDGKSIRLQDYFDSNCKESAIPVSIMIGKESFELTHIKMRSPGQKDSFVAYSANNRLVSNENLKNKVPGIMSPMHDETGAYSYVCFVSSDYLDKHVRPERTDFDLPQTRNKDSFDLDPTREEIEQAVCLNIKEQLKDDLATNLDKAEQELQAFVDNEAPQYRCLMEILRKERDYPPCGSSDSEKEQFLHKRMIKWQAETKAAGVSLLRDIGEKPYEEYAPRMKEYLKNVSDQDKSSLVEYVTHRKVILDILEKAISRGSDGKYSREDVIHTLIMPRWKDSNHTEYDDMNLWLIDERLAFHNYLASDLPLNQTTVTDSSSTDRPDLLSVRIQDAPMLVSEQFPALSSITVVELKRPMRKDTDKEPPVDQAIGYIKKLRSGRMTTAQGRPIQPANNTPAFCYVLCDIVSDSLEKMVMDFSLKKSADGLSYFGYHSGYDVYIEVITFNGLVKAAKERNHAFFDKLGLKTV